MATVGDSLVADVRARDDHLNTGIMGTQFLWDALTSTGHLDEALRAATQTTYPSYGYWISSLGWTSLGENWEAETRSRNHMMYGTVVQWFFQDLAGYRPLKAGWSQIEYKPEIPSTGLDHVSASTDTVRGVVATSWRKTAGRLFLDVTIPAGSTGEVYVPARSVGAVTEGATGKWLPASTAPGVRSAKKAGDRIVFTVGSGKYTFRVA